jgi:hypothetical protein
LKSIFIICVVLIYLWIMCIFLNYRFLKLHANNHCYANICLVYKIICFSCLFFTDSHYWWSVNFKTNDYKIGICCLIYHLEYTKIKNYLNYNIPFRINKQKNNVNFNKNIWSRLCFHWCYLQQQRTEIIHSRLLSFTKFRPMIL